MQLTGLLVFQHWIERWYVCRHHFLYIFNSKYDAVPKEALFLDGCFIEVGPVIGGKEVFGFFPEFS